MLLVIGLDGATFDLMRPWVDAGYLPTMGRLMAAGITGQLQSTRPPITAPAWASFMTGKNPGNHGVFDFFRPTADSFDLINANHIRSRTLWEYLSDADYRVGILNVPVTYPPCPVNGYLVPGLLSPDQGQTTYPPGLLTPYLSELGPYRLTPQIQFQPGREDAFIADLHHVLETQIRYMLRIVHDHPTDFLMVHFLVTDIAQHALWRYLDPSHPWHQASDAARYADAVRDLYVRIDRGMAQLLELLPAHVTVIVMSDHGFGPVHRIVNLNNFLIESGFMALRQSWPVQLRAWAFRRGISVARLRSMMRRLKLHWLIRAAREESDSTLTFEDVDWTRTLAYSKGHFGQLYINLSGREAHSTDTIYRVRTVGPGDYRAVRQCLVDSLQKLRDPDTGKPLVERIYTREELFRGRYAEQGPDVYIVMNDGRAVAYPHFAADGKIITEHRHGNSGDHREHGILIAAGAPIPAGQTIHGARLIDLAPTILYVLDVPVPDDMDGRVLENMFTPGFQARRLIRYQAPKAAKDRALDALTAEEQAEIAERLRMLGYLG